MVELKPLSFGFVDLISLQHPRLIVSYVNSVDVRG